MTAQNSSEVRSTVILCSAFSTRWRRPIWCLKLQVVFRNHRDLWRKMTYKDKTFCDSTPPCSELNFENSKEMASTIHPGWLPKKPQKSDLQLSLCSKSRSEVTFENFKKIPSVTTLRWLLRKNVLQYFAVSCRVSLSAIWTQRALQRVAACYSVWRCCVVCHCLLLSYSMCCSVLQYTAVCCSVL